jgi:hypothetical protein
MPTRLSEDPRDSDLLKLKIPLNSRKQSTRSLVLLLGTGPSRPRLPMRCVRSRRRLLRLLPVRSRLNRGE